MFRKHVAMLGLLALALAASFSNNAPARMLRGDSFNVQQTATLTTVTFTNPSGSASPANTFVSWGQLFHCGDVPAGWSPVIAIGGVQYQVQGDQRTTCADGSLQFARLTTRIPSMAGSASQSVNLLAQSTPFNNNPTRTLADVSASSIRASITSLANFSGLPEGSGSWTAAANDGIAAGGAQVKVNDAGPIFSGWRIIVPWTDNTGGAANTDLWQDFYVEAYTNSDGSLGPLRVMSGWGNGGLKSLNDGLATYAISTATSASQSVVNSGTITFTTPTTGLRYWPGQAVSVVLSAGTYMWGTVQSYSGTTLTVTMTGKIGFGSSTSWYIIPSPTLYTFTAALQTGGGASTIRTISNITSAAHSGGWLAGANGQADWTDGRASIFVAQSKTYLLTSNQIPPFDPTLTLSISDSVYTPAQYSPAINGCIAASPLLNVCNGLGYTADRSFYNEAYYVLPGTNTSGEREDIGWWPAWSLRAWNSQGPNFTQTDLVRSLATRMATTNFINTTTWTIPTLNNGSDSAGTPYSGLGSIYSTTWQNATTSQISNDLLAIQGPGTFGNTNGWYGTAGITSLPDMEHWPSTHFHPYLHTGDIWHMDMAKNEANQAELTRSPSVRNTSTTVGGVLFKSYGFIGGNGFNIRSQAWGDAQLAQVSAFLPDTAPEKSYVRDNLSADLSTTKWYFNTYYPSLANLAPAYTGNPATALGFYFYPVLPVSPTTYTNSSVHNFMPSYMLQAISGVYLITGNTDALWLGNYLMNWYKGMNDNIASYVYFEQYYMGGFELNTGTPTYIGSSSRVGFMNTDGGGIDSGNRSALVFTNGSATIKLAMTSTFTGTASLNSAPTWKPVNGQAIRFPTFASTGGGNVAQPALPPEFSYGTTYYIQNASIASVYSLPSYRVTVTPSTLNSFELTTCPPPTVCASIVPSTTQTAGVDYAFESPASIPLGEVTPGWGGGGPGAYGNLVVTGTTWARKAAFNNAAAVNDNVKSAVTTYTNAIAINTPSNNPKIVSKYP